MHEKRRWMSLPLLVAMLATPVAAQRQDPGESPNRPAGVMELPHLKVDLEARQIVLDAEVVQANYALEFLLCKAGTKEYESVLSTRAEPSHLHAALLALGLMPGKPAQYVGGEYLPPRGAELEILLRWEDEDGKTHEAAAVDWLKLRDKPQPQEGFAPAPDPAEEDEPETADAKPESWVFLGSEILPGGNYAADLNGGIIAVANLASAVIDVPMVSTQRMELREFEIDEEAIPPVDTPVEVIITPREGATRAPHARALLEIDRFGRMNIDGEAIALEELEAWANAFTRRHPKARVVIRSAPRALAIDSQLARSELKLGGVFDFEFRVAPLRDALLPRTPEQMKTHLDRWRDRFAHPREELYDPAERARQTIEEIQRRKEELRRRIELWDRYERRLSEQLEGASSSDE